MLPGQPPPGAGGSGWTDYWIDGRGADLLGQVDQLAGDRVFAGERDAYRAFDTRTGRYFFDRAPCELFNQVHRGQLHGYGCRMELRHGQLMPSERDAALIHLKGGGLVVVQSQVWGDIRSEGAPVCLAGSDILGDVWLDHGGLQMVDTSVSGTLTLRTDRASIGPGCRINHLVLRAPERRPGEPASVLPRIELHPGANVSRISADAPTYEVVRMPGPQRPTAP